MSYRDDCRRALEIARRHRKHSEAVKEIIAIGLAQDAGGADELIREGEYDDSLRER